MSKSLPQQHTLMSLMQNEMRTLDHVIDHAIASDVTLVEQVVKHILKTGGKRIRPLLTFASYHLALSTCSSEIQNDIDHFLISDSSKDYHDAHALAAAVELIHTATLLHDDVIDMSDMRRGEPAAHTIFGNTAAILVGDYLFSKAFQLMVSCQTTGVLDILSKVAALITEGEVLQLSHSFDVSLSVENYLKIVTHKTAVLFEASTHVGAKVGLQNHSPDFAESLRLYGHNLGMAFQILDDIYDYFPPKDFGKRPGVDLSEGKITLPIILLLNRLEGTPDKTWVEQQFSSRSTHPINIEKSLQKICSLYITYGIEKDALSFAKRFVDKAIDTLANFPESPLKSALINLPQDLLKRHIQQTAA